MPALVVISRDESHSGEAAIDDMAPTEEAPPSLRDFCVSGHRDAPSRLPVSSALTDRQTILARRVRMLVAATITYNVVEAAIALTAGSMASSSGSANPSPPSRRPGRTR